MLPPIEWTLQPDNPVIMPGGLNGALDALHAGSGHVLKLGDSYRLYYWAKGEDSRSRICMAQSSVDRPNEWQGLGAVLERQENTDYNWVGPSFPFVLPRSGRPWLMYFGGWGKARADGKLPNSTGLALSDDDGVTWRHWGDEPVMPLDRPWDCEGTGSVSVIETDGRLRMYYTAIGSYAPKPEGVRTGHGEIIPRIGVGYAESDDGVHWDKPLDDLMVSPRGFDTEPYEYISSKPFVLRDSGGWRMWVSTFGYAYRVRSLVSSDGLHWQWAPGGIGGDLGVGEPGGFDDHQRCYACVLKEGDEYRCWFTANGFGATGMGYATGRARSGQ